MRSLAALLVGVLLVVSVAAGVGAGHPGDDQAHSPSAVSNPSADLSDAPSATEFADGPKASSHAIAPSDLSALTSQTQPAVNSSTNGTSADETTNVTARDGTQMYVTVQENGDARWNVTARFVLDDANETAAFRQLAQNYEDEVADVGFTRSTFQSVLERAGTDTDRGMELRNVGRSSVLRENGSVGELSLSFTWTNFTVVEDNRIVLGDVFWVGSETWLPALTADQSLTVEGPPGYYVDSAKVPINGTRIHFEGPRTFEPDDFSVTYAPKRTVTTTANTTNTTTATDGFPGLLGTSGLLVVLVVFGIGFGAYGIAQRRGPDPDVSEPAGTDDAPPSAAPRDDRSDDGPADASAAPDEDSEGPPPELLSDEERVLRLLRDNDGRMKQADIVKETNWSNAKVSQLLSKMNDDGEVNKLRIGRENLITLPDEDVTDLD